MNPIARFAAYAAAFEKACASDDWTLVAPFFTDDAEYEVGLGPPIGPSPGSLVSGREEILAWFKRVLDGFDRRFATREVTLREGPRVDGSRVWIRGSARYTSPAAPPLEFELEETATFEGDRIRRLEDRYSDAERKALARYLEVHGAALDIGLP